MPTLTAALVHQKDASRQLVEALAASSVVSELVFIDRERIDLKLNPRELRKTQFVESDFFSGPAIAHLLEAVKTDYLLLALPGEQIDPGARALERMLQAADESGAGLVYADFKDQIDGELSDHPLIDCQPGSIRDNFDFGPLILLSKRAVETTLRKHGGVEQKLKWAGLYDLRLKLSIEEAPLRIPEPLYRRAPMDKRASGERQFDYVDPRKRDYQREMERVAGSHLKKIGAFLHPQFKSVPPPAERFPVRASVVIPVRNRERTIRDAVMSALSQKTPFEYNVIVVDNHSTDRTTEILSDLASKHAQLVHAKPTRTDLGIGGCWNEAVYSKQCGEFAVQLDSDDLYSDDQTLAKIVARLEQGPFAMVIGSYTIVDFQLNPIPPGLIDHREWTRANGRNNALRINGLGAPRAFYVPVLRQFGFPNTSYGEDYATALRISRDYEIGRIYESIYFARRWEGNSDAALPLATANRYDYYKDHLRTVEIRARQRMNER
ncbi:MAG TPA: glycosyltransferase family A protein [Blastocatellia bacterium]|nr:glycosyltransferase family A protein [Blastocatellia bacterium]